jgi:hypothetical protein
MASPLQVKGGVGGCLHSVQARQVGAHLACEQAEWCLTGRRRAAQGGAGHHEVRD